MQGKNAVVKVLIYVEENRGIQNKNSLNKVYCIVDINIWPNSILYTHIFS